MYVQPLLEYAVVVWSPWTEQNCELLEKVQRRAIRMMSDVKGKTYEQKLKDAGLMLLKERRIRGDMIETFKTIKRMNKVKNGLKWWGRIGEQLDRTRQLVRMEWWKGERT